ncbi:MAG TPA: PilZ domain-containing protein [Kofleriaceae bacterium]|nr:PilZ domain-containing protein [Kofleriaceae bacterium]
MNDLLALVFEYRTLLARRRREGELLGLPERRRLDALERLLGREPTDAEETGELGRRRHARCDVRLDAELRVAGRVVAMSVVDLGAGGIGVVAGERLPAGARGALRVSSAESARVYDCRAEVTWSGGGAGTWRAGLRFLPCAAAMRLAS